LPSGEKTKNRARGANRQIGGLAPIYIIERFSILSIGCASKKAGFSKTLIINGWGALVARGWGDADLLNTRRACPDQNGLPER
jgi:hypothetical protein